MRKGTEKKSSQKKYKWTCNIFRYGRNTNQNYIEDSISPQYGYCQENKQ
jgi:hypothetical protein